jgi:hypothetical protein
MRLIGPPNGGGMGLTAIDGARLGHAVPADGFGEEACGPRLIALLREEDINGLAALIDGAREIAPYFFRRHRDFIHPPADPDRALVAMEHCFQLRAVLQDPAIDRRMVNVHPTFLHRLFDMAVAQRVGHRPPHARPDHVVHERGSREAHHGHAPSLRTLGHRGTSYPK